MTLGVFQGQQLGQWFVARTGYTGEDGFELMLPAGSAAAVWRQLNAEGVASCGLGARDTLRLEAGMNLYGNDMDESTHPFESGLGWTVAMQPPGRDFIGRKALESVLSGSEQNARKLVGLVLEDRGVLRSHQQVLIPGSGGGKVTGCASEVTSGKGEVTSGTFSPTLNRSIALARIPATAPGRVQVDIRGKLLNARVVKPPFVRLGKAKPDILETS
jgi:aminomethyltransferase